MSRLSFRFSLKQFVDLKADLLEELKSNYPEHVELFGHKLVNSKYEPVTSCIEIYQTPLICVLFACQWSSPCNVLIQDLIKLYEESNQGKKNLEIIQVTIDRDSLPGEGLDLTIDEVRKEEEMKFRNYISNKPWVFTVFNDDKNKVLMKKFDISSVPQFIVLNRDCSVITYRGRQELAEEGYEVALKWSKLIVPKVKKRRFVENTDEILESET